MLSLLNIRFYFTRILLQSLSVNVGVSVTPVSQLNGSLTFPAAMCERLPNTSLEELFLYPSDQRFLSRTNISDAGRLTGVYLSGSPLITGKLRISVPA